jgi:hypothetical protein
MKKKNKKQKKVLIGNKKPMVFAWLVVGVFVVLQVFLAVHSASTGAELAHFEKEASQLSNQNRTLSDELIRSSSLLKTGESSEDLGYFAPQNTLYLTSDEFVAKLP